MPLFLTLALRGIFTWRGLVWIFFLRVAVCSFGTIICLSSPFDTKPGPLCRTLGTADDMVVVSLLLICMINICQQIASNGVNMARSAAQSMLSESWLTQTWIPWSNFIKRWQASLWFGAACDGFVILLLTKAEAGLSNTQHSQVSRCASPPAAGCTPHRTLARLFHSALFCNSSSYKGPKLKMPKAMKSA